MEKPEIKKQEKKPEEETIEVIQTVRELPREEVRRYLDRDGKTIINLQTTEETLDMILVKLQKIEAKL